MNNAPEIQRIVNADAYAQQVLDELVHDAASRLASSVNNDGIKAQLDFLNRCGIEDDEVLERIAEAVGKVGQVDNG